MLAAERAPSAFEFAVSRQGEDPLVSRASASNTDKNPPRRQDLVSLARRILGTSEDDNEELGFGTIIVGSMEEPGSSRGRIANSAIYCRKWKGPSAKRKCKWWFEERL